MQNPKDLINILPGNVVIWCFTLMILEKEKDTEIIHFSVVNVLKDTGVNIYTTILIRVYFFKLLRIYI